jgi:hypothetical protein
MFLSVRGDSRRVPAKDSRPTFGTFFLALTREMLNDGNRLRGLRGQLQKSALERNATSI